MKSRLKFEQPRKRLFYLLYQAPRSRKISTGPGMPTIRDEESDVKPRRPKHEVKPRRPESEVNVRGPEPQASANPRRVLPQISVTSVPETESESLVN